MPTEAIALIESNLERIVDRRYGGDFAAAIESSSFGLPGSSRARAFALLARASMGTEAPGLPGFAATASLFEAFGTEDGRVTRESIEQGLHAMAHADDWLEQLKLELNPPPTE